MTGPSVDPGAAAEARNRRPVLDLAISLAALVVLVVLAVVGAAGRTTDSSERFGYVLGSIVFSLLVSLAARWLWLRAKGRADLRQLRSPWIPIGAVILMILALFGRPQA